MIRPLRDLLWKAGWAPVGVLIFHAAIAYTPLRDPLDFLVHFLGGASMAYFCFHALECFAAILGLIKLPVRYFLCFTFACTVGLFWEFGELFSDVVRHTHIQRSLPETMSDLIADTTGGATALLLVFVTRWLLRSRSPL